MKISLRRPIAAAILFAGIVLIVFTVSPAYSQAPAQTAPSPTPTVTPTPTTAAGTVTELTRLPPALDVWGVVGLLLITFLFALIAWGILFAYTYMIQIKYYDLVSPLARGGVNIKTLVTGELTPSRGGKLDTSEPAGKIEGPDAIPIGSPTTEFKAQGADGKPVSVTWSVDPANAALVNPETGQTTKVMAAVAGVFTLKATTGNNNWSKKVAAVAPQANQVELPFIGRGYASIAVTVLLLAIIIILGLSSVLPRDAIAPLLGTLVGYIFGVSQQQAQTPKKGDEGGG